MRPSPDNWQQALQGEFGPLVDAWVDADASERRAIDALLSLVSDREPPAPELCTDSPRALRFLALRAVLRGRANELRQVAEAQVLAALDPGLTRRWLGIFDGTLVQSERSESADGRIEEACLSALEQLFLADVPSAVQHARRAVRMARAEAMVLHELLASIVLARCRRLQGRPHLAMRILATVAEVAPPLFHGWVRYEQRFCGASVGERDSDFAPEDHLNAFFDGLNRADVEGLSRAVSTAPAWVRRELCVLAESCVPQLPPSVSPAGWLDGRSVVCPAEILGMCVPEIRDGGEQSPLLLLLDPQRPVRRVLVLGAPMMSGIRVPDSFEVKQGRAMATLAWLATEPDLDRASLFERVYGFTYQSERHGGTLRVLLHRMRQGLPDGVRFGERLEVDEAALIPDPRVEFDQEALVLRHLAKHQGRASAREIAEALGVSSRTVQTVLRGMLDDGICSSVRDGRRIEYRLEDTTLSEPTVSRLHPRGLTQLNEL